MLLISVGSGGLNTDARPKHSALEKHEKTSMHCRTFTGPEEGGEGKDSPDAGRTKR